MSKRILVVEDQPDNRQIIRDMLDPTDYQITAAENGEQALAAVAKQRPDLILMDIQLPIMDGYEATRRIKADASLRSIPIIAVTSMRSAAKDKRRGQRAVMIMFRNLSVRANCWRRFGNTCNSGRHVSSNCSQPRCDLKCDILPLARHDPRHGADPWSGENSLHLLAAL